MGIGTNKSKWSGLIFVLFLAACSVNDGQEPVAKITATASVSPTIFLPTLTPTSMIEPSIELSTSTPVNTPLPDVSDGPIGLGLRQETVNILLDYKNCSGLTMAASSEMAESYFPQLEGWIRVLGAPSLADLGNKGDKANTNGLPYEGLGYGLETSQTTPEQEWKNLVESTGQAREMVDVYDKMLIMGPGFQLMSRNEDKYAPMAALTDLWMLQTQQLQKNPPGPAYRAEVERLVGLIRSENPDIKIWAQITLPPDREPDANEWLAYRQLIVDLVDGTYIGVYTWDRVDNEVLISTVDSIFNQVCGENRDQ